MLIDAYSPIDTIISFEIAPIKGSRFLGYILTCTSKNDITAHIATIRNQHPKASHYTRFARIGVEGQKDLFGNTVYTSVYNSGFDDGEPHGSAQYPIKNILIQKGLYNVFACVVRYYGGIKLGIGGLVKAYTSAMQGVSDIAQYKPLIFYRKTIVQVPYDILAHFIDICHYNKVQYTLIETIDQYNAVQTMELYIADVSIAEIDGYIQKTGIVVLNNSDVVI